MKIILARHQENTAWADIFDDKFIVQKDQHIPNWGREPSSFLWYIIENYDNLEGDYAFIQGNPFPHCNNLFQHLREPFEGFRWLGNEILETDATGRPHDPGLPLTEVCAALGLTPTFPLRFCPGGQFVVNANAIKKRPREWYEKAMIQVRDAYRGPWCFERLWEEVFK